MNAPPELAMPPRFALVVGLAVLAVHVVPSGEVIILGSTADVKSRPTATNREPFQATSNRSIPVAVSPVLAVQVVPVGELLIVVVLPF
jgi:hypothetical protein